MRCPGWERTEDLLRRVLQALHDRGLGPEPDKAIDSIRRKATGRLEASIVDLFGGLVGSASATFGAVAQLLGMVFVAGYLLAEGGRLKAAAMAITPARYRPDLESLVANVGRSLSQYLAGLVASAAIQGALSALVLWLLDVPNALLLGVLTAVASTLPLIGIVLAASLAIAAALTQSPPAAGLTALAYVAIDQLDRRALSPFLQSRALRVSLPITFLAVVAVGRAVFDFLVERLRVMPPTEAAPATDAVTAQGPGHPGRLAPLVNLTMSVFVLPHKGADVRNASRMALQVGDATLTKERNRVRVDSGTEDEEVLVNSRH